MILKVLVTINSMINSIKIHLKPINYSLKIL